MGLAPEIVAMVNAILSHRPTAVPSDGALPMNRGTAENKEAATATATSAGPKAEPVVDDRQETATSQADADGGQTPQAENPTTPTPPQTPVPTPVPTTPKELTAEDVRAAMHRTRQRIEGEDYKENTDSEAYRKYHKPLTAQFKNIASLLGSDKPSALPCDRIAEFIEQCGLLTVKEDGTIGTECPF